MKKLICLVIAMTLSAASFCSGAQTLSLDGKWTLDYWVQEKVPVTSPRQMNSVNYKTIEASVPGNVELDLLAAGLIPDPETGSNVYAIRRVEGYQWRYSRKFISPQTDASDEILLKFGGIDCYAEIWVNGKHAGSADNMLIEHSFPVTELLAPAGGENTVEVIIRSSVVEARRQMPPAFSNNWQRPETVFTRRAPHSYGWDIMPRLVSAGLWKSVCLETVHPVHIRDVHWMTSWVNTADKTAKVLVDYNVTLPIALQEGQLKAHVTISRNGQTKYDYTEPVVMSARRIRIELKDVDFWWPRGYGEPALYDAEFELIGPDGKVADRDSRKLGIRTITLDRTDIHTDAEPGRFCFLVNGEPVFIHGSNWTPMDALHSRDPQHLEKTMALAVDLNCNMLRCWGGNVYESDRFYDLCDENGIMIWQDFSMGCSFYPQTEEFQRTLEKELYSVVRRLRSHACIALWAGNNEDDEVMTDGNFNGYRPDPNRDVVSRRTIPNVLFELDPTRDYLPSSPFWSEEMCRRYYNTDALPERHLWGPRGYYKDSFYTTESKCIFASETGYHGMPCRESLERMFPKESVYPWTDRKNFHWKDDWICKAVTEYKEYGYYHERNDLMINQVRQLFGNVPVDLDEFIFASQSVQAEAMKYFVERFRGTKFCPRTGILWWNVRDGWPIISDAVVDWYFNPKMAYWFIRNVQRDLCVMMLDAEEGKHPLVVSNDTRKPASGKVEVRDLASGKTVYKGNYSVEANGRAVICGIPETGGQGMYLISYTDREGKPQRNHYLYGKAPFKLSEYKDLLAKTGIRYSR